MLGIGELQSRGIVEHNGVELVEHRPQIDEFGGDEISRRGGQLFGVGGDDALPAEDRRDFFLNLCLFLLLISMEP